jgi:hypothetical protein
MYLLSICSNMSGLKRVSLKIQICLYPTENLKIPYYKGKNFTLIEAMFKILLAQKSFLISWP